MKLSLRFSASAPPMVQPRGFHMLAPAPVPLRDQRAAVLEAAVGEVGEKVKEAIAGGAAEAEKLREAATRATTKAS